MLGLMCVCVPEHLPRMHADRNRDMVLRSNMAIYESSLQCACHE